MGKRSTWIRVWCVWRALTSMRSVATDIPSPRHCLHSVHGTRVALITSWVGKRGQVGWVSLPGLVCQLRPPINIFLKQKEKMEMMACRWFCARWGWRGLPAHMCAATTCDLVHVGGGRPSLACGASGRISRNSPGVVGHLCWRTAGYDLLTLGLHHTKRTNDSAVTAYYGLN